jgi:hypothetical protein
VAEAEIKAGLRVRDADRDGTRSNDAATLTATAAAPAAPSGDLKRMFRDVARAVHPDALPDAQHDERTRYRRHSLMAKRIGPMRSAMRSPASDPARLGPGS